MSDMTSLLSRTARDRSRLRAAFPSGIATARRLAAVGISERTAYHRCLDGGPWRRLLPGIIMLGNGEPTVRQLIEAALLLGGPDAVVTDLHACRLHGLRRGPIGRAGPHEVALLVPKQRQVRSTGFAHVQRTTRLPDPVVRGGFPVAPIERACLDAVRRLESAAEITELLAEAVQRGLCTASSLAGELARGSRRGTAMPTRVLADVAAGVRSTAERDARRLWLRGGLPEARWNVPVHRPDGTLIGVADCWVDEIALAWEIESSEWHLSPDAHDRTVVRAAEFTAAGVVYTATKPKRLTTDPEEVLRTLRETCARARTRPRPPLRVGHPRS